MLTGPRGATPPAGRAALLAPEPALLPVATPRPALSPAVSVITGVTAPTASPAPDPSTAGAPGRAAAPNVPVARPAAAAAAHRMPFVLLLCGLLGGALICALVISTTLAEGSFQITRLQESTNALAQQRQALQEQVAQAQSAQVIQSRAFKLGLRTQGELRFLDLKTGAITTDRGDSTVNDINVPGYTP